jgi:hypothetical protein
MSKPKNNREAWTKKDEKYIEKAAKDGMSTKQIAKDLDRTESAVRHNAHYPITATRSELEVQYKSAYLELGNIRGEYATPKGRHSQRKVWIQGGQDAAFWLIERIREETNPSILDTVAEVLSDIGLPALAPILAELEAEETNERLTPIIEALAWIELPAHSPVIKKRAKGLITRFLASSIYEVRDSAIRASRALNDDLAVDLLKNALHNEHSDLREDLIEEIEARS